MQLPRPPLLGAKSNSKEFILISSVGFRLQNEVSFTHYSSESGQGAMYWIQVSDRNGRINVLSRCVRTSMTWRCITEEL